MTTIKLSFGRLGNSMLVKALLTLFIAVWAAHAALADTAARTISLLAPLDGATVRENVPIRISPADLPANSYVTVSIDKIFRTAKLVDPGKSLIYTWDSKAAYQDPSNPGTDKYIEDGPHEIEVAVYTASGLYASGNSNITLANKVTNLPDGVQLSYNWSENETLRYKRHSDINVLSQDPGVTPQTTQSADIYFTRSVEDTSGGNYLVRDMVSPNGTLTSNGQSVPVQNLFLLKSRYRTVNRFGNTLVEEAPFSDGDHFGFPIAEVPDRRISAGDAWQTKLEVAITWANAKPTILYGSAKLDSYEWQNGYPTAKIIETYTGPAKFYADAKGTVQFHADNVTLTRTYWFAYNSRRLVRMKTDMTIDSNVTSDVYSLLGGTGTGTGAPGMGGMGTQGGMMPGMIPGGGMPGGGTQGNPYPGGGGTQGSPYMGGPQQGRPDSEMNILKGLTTHELAVDPLLQPDEAGSPYGGMNQYRPPMGSGSSYGSMGQQGGQATTTTPLKLEVIDDTNLVGV